LNRLGKYAIGEQTLSLDIWPVPSIGSVEEFITLNWVHEVTSLIDVYLF